MKKVRFESSVKIFNTQMEDTECHSPRPYIQKYANNIENVVPRVLPYRLDTIHRFENGNSSPYPRITKTSLGPPMLPSNDLELSILDSSMHEGRRNINDTQILEECVKAHVCNDVTTIGKKTTKPLTSIENITPDQCSMNKIIGNSFFMRRDNPQNLNFTNTAPIHHQFQRLCAINSKDEVQLAKNQDNLRLFSRHNNIKTDVDVQKEKPTELPCDRWHCHHNNENTINTNTAVQKQIPQKVQSSPCSACHAYQCCTPHSHHGCNCMHCSSNCKVNSCDCNKSENPNSVQNGVDKKTWMLQKYENNCKDICTETERIGELVKEKKEPTVADLFRIIKLQNEQLQHLQEKVDKFILTNSNRPNQPIQNCVSDNVRIEGAGDDNHKISIGVMTSFELVRTSTVINKEIVTHSNDNTQIHCNRSQISVKEVLSKSPVNMNILEGILPAKKSIAVQAEDDCEQRKLDVDKSFNEVSLYNVQVDNTTTPLISPEQSLYLDVRDYSDSDSESDNQSNVGWTYYNKVMTHVNGMLQDSDMPSSASALYRNTQKQCIQMQIDKTNVSVTKRVTFNDDQFRIHQPNMYTAQTDTSLKMSQLATKYLKGKSLSAQCPAPKPPVVPIDMSFATRNYMERHKILQGCTTLPPPPVNEIPKFLDITAIKQQPKL